MERERAKDENLAGPQGRDSRPDLALVNCQQKKKTDEPVTHTLKWPVVMFNLLRPLERLEQFTECFFKSFSCHSTELNEHRKRFA